MPPPKIILQRIRIVWTKASRGAPRASKRASIADALALPTQRRAGRVFVHDMVADERNAFEFVAGPKIAATDRARASSAERGFFGPVEWVALEDGSLAVSLRPEGTGAPRRPVRRLFALQPGQWGKLVVNERIAVEETWLYAQSVVNVAFATPLRADLFEGTQPVKAVDLRARLR
jgi:hypothetical protein